MKNSPPLDRESKIDNSIADATSIPRLHSAEIRKSSIPPSLSIYLDLVRFLAAVCVVFYHGWPVLFPDSHIKWPGHEAVVVFFVLSGYVIAHAATRPGVTVSTYVSHRVARIVPVAWLALILGLLLSMYLLPKSQWSALAFPSLVNAFFVGQSGWAFLNAPLNPPYWSLNYEVWYYIIFGCWLFAPLKWRNVLTILAILIAGPKILLLFPIWLYGVWLYHRMPVMKVKTAMLVFLVTLTLGALGTWMNLSDILRTALYAAFPPAWRLHFSTQFLYDLLLGVVVTFNFASVAALASTVGVPKLAARVIRLVAGYTFSLYVFHSLLIELFDKVFHITNPWLFFAMMIPPVVLLGQLTEQRTAWFRARLSWKRDSTSHARLNQS